MPANLWKTGSINALQTTLNGGISSSDTSIILTSVTGLSTTGGILCLDRTDSAGTATPTKREYISYTAIATLTLTGVTRGVAGSTAQSHNSGIIVEETFTTTHWLDLLTAVQNVLTSAGALDTTKVVDLTTAQTLTNKILTSPTINTPTIATPTISSATITTSTLTSPTISSPTLRAWDGWTDANETWTYASATTITVPSGAASKYQVGDKIKLTQTTVKYFYIISIADTVLTITGGADYTLINAAISANSYTHTETPIGFPTTFAYTSTIAGFSVAPTTQITRFWVKGDRCFVEFVLVGGTSGGTNFTMTLPITAKTISGMEWDTVIRARNAGTLNPDPALGAITSGAASAAFFVDLAGNAWTNTGQKDAWGTLPYEI